MVGNFPQLDSKAVDLHLVINTSLEHYRTVSAEVASVPGAIEPFLVFADQAFKEALAVDVWQSEVAWRKAGSGETDLAALPLFAKATLVNQVDAGVLDREADGEGGILVAQFAERIVRRERCALCRAIAGP